MKHAGEEALRQLANLLDLPAVATFARLIRAPHITCR
jgi:hypothetical protein